MSIELPPCPITQPDDTVIKLYVGRERLIDTKRRGINARIGVASNRLSQLNRDILSLETQQAAARQLYPDALSPESIERYEAWLDSIEQAVLSDNTATNAR